MNNIEKEISRSSKAFTELVWPIIANYLGGGTIYSVEGVVTECMQKRLDVAAGIDFWQVLPDNIGIRGIASRIQPSDKCWGTFTIRRYLLSGSETEYHKRMRAILRGDKGYLYPRLTIQAYVGTGYVSPVYGVGIIDTNDLFAAAVLHDWELKPVDGGNKMLVLDWERLRQLKYKIKVF